MSKATMKSRAALLSLVVCAAVCAGCNRTRQESTASDPKTVDEQLFYTLGTELASNVEAFALSPAELRMVQLGLTDAVSKHPSRADLETFRPKISQLARQRRVLRVEEQKKIGGSALEKAAQQPGARRLPSGVVIRTLLAGNGVSPGPTDRVKVNYEGRLIDGTVFDSSKGDPIEFHLQSVARCWIEGIQQMKIGEKAELTCPSSLAYGDTGNPPKIPGGATLIFNLELIEITAAATTPKAAESP